MKNRISLYFPTAVMHGTIPRAQKLNKELRREIQILSEIDEPGRRWSRKNYVGGYSSYNSETQLHHTSPNFSELKNLLNESLKKFIQSLQWDLLGRKIEMTTCWVNQMGAGSHHTMHIHPLSVLSGVYFIDCPKGSSPFKFEDPRLGLFMNTPPRKSNAKIENQNYILIDPKPGDFILFESWMRHEVPPHRGAKPRLSTSFNYEWL